MEEHREEVEKTGELEWAKLWSEGGMACGRMKDGAASGPFDHRERVPKPAQSTHVLPTGGRTEVKVFMGAPTGDED